MKIKKCRLCNREGLKSILDYGNIALVDSFPDSDEEIKNEKKYPLELCICSHCKHLQINEVVEPSLLFEDYPWETGISKSIVKFSQELYGQVIRCHDEGSSKRPPRVLEIASNDGSILFEFKKNGCEILGVDPAKNIVKIANERGIQSIARFFDLQTAKWVVDQYGQWDVCLARNVLAHVKDLHGVAKGIKTILKSDGFAVIEVPHLKKMFQELQYDQVFHEHLGYHSLDSIKRLFGMYELEVFDVEEIWIHGGSIRVFLQQKGGVKKIRENVQKVLDEEIRLGLFEETAWKTFAEKALLHKKLLVEELQKRKQEGRKVAIYGASGKGQSLLQFCNIDTTIIDFVVDKSKMKQSKFTPGTHIKIFPTSKIYEEKPDIILLCAWNFSKEIVEQEKSFVANGGKFLHPFPSPHYIQDNQGK